MTEAQSVAALRRQRIPRAPSALEERLAWLLRHYMLVPVREFVFHPTRKWRFDFAFPDRKLAIECEGGTWGQGRHTRGSGFAKDCEKYNAAAMAGWRVLRFTKDMIDNGYAIRSILEALQ